MRRLRGSRGPRAKRSRSSGRSSRLEDRSRCRSGGSRARACPRSKRRSHRPAAGGDDRRGELALRIERALLDLLIDANPREREQIADQRDVVSAAARRVTSLEQKRQAPSTRAWRPTAPPTAPDTYTFTSVDNAGNISHVTETVYLDTTKPVATVTSPTSGQTFTDNVTINGSATDNLGTGFVNVYVDGTFVTGLSFPTNGSFSYTTTLPTDGSANGPHTVSFVASDAAGNLSDPADFTFTLTAAGPAVHLTAPAEGQAVNSAPAFTGSVANISEANNLTASVDGGAPVSVTVDSQGNFSFTPSVTGDGPHSVTFSADAPYTSVTRSFVLDTTAPTANVTSPGNGQTFNTNPTITGTSSDATSGVALAHVSVDDAPAIDVPVDAQGNFTFTPSFATDGSADGDHTVSVTVTDKAGNSSTAILVTFKLDTVAPVVNLNGPADGVSQNTSPQFFGQATEANGLSSLTVSVDGGAAQALAHDAQGNFSFDPICATDGSADGAHTYVFTATDAAGNVSTVSRHLLPWIRPSRWR